MFSLGDKVIVSLDRMNEYMKRIVFLLEGISESISLIGNKLLEDSKSAKIKK